MACYNCSEYWQLWVKNLVVVLSHVMSQKTMFLVLFSITVCVGGVCQTYACILCKTVSLDRDFKARFIHGCQV